MLSLDRASIRFYEKEGLISPARLANGYRDYSDADAAELRRIRLLRGLGVSIGDIRALQTGERALPDTLAARAEALHSEAAAAARAEEICRALAQENAAYAGLDAEPYLSMLSGAAGADDRLPSAFEHPWRRFFARWIDLALCELPVIFVLCVLLRVPYAVTGACAETLGLLLMLAVEPLLLSRLGTTPGKRLCGLTLRDADGEKLTYTAAFQRLVGVVLYGFGLGLPVIGGIVKLALAWRLFRGRHESERTLYMMWDWEENYTVDARDGQDLVCGGVLAACFCASVLLVGQAALPPHHGRLTMAEYVANSNDANRFHADGALGTMDETGQWAGGRKSMFGDKMDLTQEVELDADGYVTRVKVVRSGEHVRTYTGGTRAESAALLAFAVAGTHRTGLGYLLDQAMWGEAEKLAAHDGTMTVGDYTITAVCEDETFVRTAQNEMISLADGGHALYFSYEITYTPGEGERK